MRWLLHAGLTPAVADALRRHEQHPVTLAEVGLSEQSEPAEVVAAAHQRQVELMTADSRLPAAIYEAGARFNRTLVYLQLEGSDVEQDDAIDRLFKRYKRLTPGRMYTVTASRVKVRQLPHFRQG